MISLGKQNILVELKTPQGRLLSRRITNQAVYQKKDNTFVIRDLTKAARPYVWFPVVKEKNLFVRREFHDYPYNTPPVIGC